MMLGACSAPSSQAPQAVVPPSTKPEASELVAVAKQDPVPIDCAAKNAPVLCASLAHMDQAYTILNALGASISLDRLTAKALRKTSGATAPDLAKVNAELDASMAGLTPADITVLQPAISAMRHCTGVLTSTEKRTDDAFDGQRDECTLHTRRLIGEAKAQLHIAGAELPPDFMNLRWGDDHASVKRAIGKQPAGEDANTLIYKETLGAHDAQLYLTFVDGQLAGAIYGFEDKHTNDNAYVEDFSQLDQLLIEKYGKPYYSGMEWADSLYKGEPSRYGMALATGRMRQVSAWTLDSTFIRHIVSGDNFEIHHLIGYRSREFAWALSQAATKKAAAGL